jgi:hypothetical protein
VWNRRRSPTRPPTGRGFYCPSRRQSLPPDEIDGALTLLGVVPAVEFGLGLGAMNYIAFVLGRALAVAMVVGLSLLLLIAIICGTTIFMLYS